MRKISISSIVITIITIIILLTIFGTMIYYQNSEQHENIVNNMENCEHDWVVTSKYDFFRESYKTITKCSKCRKEV